MCTGRKNIRIAADLHARYSHLAAATGQSRARLIAEALEDYIAREEWQISQIAAALTAQAAGRPPVSAEEALARHLDARMITQDELAAARARYGPR